MEPKRIEMNNLAAEYLNISLIVHLIGYIYECLNRVPLEMIIQTYIQMFLAICILIRAIKKGRIRIKHFAIWIFIAWMLIIVFSYYFFYPADFLMKKVIFQGISHIIIPIWLLTLVSNIDVFVMSLKKFIPLAILYCVMQLIYKTNSPHEYFIFTYSILPAVLLLLVLSIEDSNIVYKLGFGFVFISVLLFGARVALLCIAFELILLFLLNSCQTNRWILFFVFSLAVFPVFYFYKELVEIFVDIFPNARIFTYLSGQLEGDSRLRIWGHLLSKILEDPITVRGILSDRIELATNVFWRFLPEQVSALYAHNFLIETLFDFGICGLAFIVLFFAKIYKAFRICKVYNDKNVKIVFVTFTSYFLGKLSVSSSFLFDITTGYFIGMLFLLANIHRKQGVTNLE